MAKQRCGALLFAFLCACGSSDGSDGSEEATPGAGGSATDVSGDPGGPNPGSEGVTYHGSIRPVLEANCLDCHIEGGAGPFRLDDYGSVMDVRDAVQWAVASGYMPPWPASGECNPLREVRALPAETIALFEEWADNEYLEGDPATYRAPAATAFVDPGEPQLVFDAGEPFYPNKAIADQYHCFLTNGVFQEDTYVTGMDVLPGVPEQVHHVQVHKIPAYSLGQAAASDQAYPGPGYVCAGTNLAGAVNVHSWRPGNASATFEPGDAVYFEAGSGIVLQVHYNNQFLAPGEDPLPDLTQVAFWTLPAGTFPERIIYRASILGPVGPTNIVSSGMIPAGEPHAVGDGLASLGEISRVGRTTTSFGTYVQGEIVGMTPHMHTLGTRISSTMQRADGTQSCMLEVPQWDFEWQLDYYFAEPMQYGPNDAITIRCEYDNSPANQPILNGVQVQPRDVLWGEGSLDEMCLQYVWFRYPRDAFLAAL